MEKVQIKQIEQLNQSHGDHLVLCFVAFHNLKTYAYLSLKQLEIINSNFDVENLEEVVVRPSWYTLKKAKEEKFILNIGLLFLLNKKTEWELQSAKKDVASFKKLPLAQMLLSDQPEIFHGHKTKYSYKNIGHFRFSDFSTMGEKSIAIKIWNMSKLSDLATFLFGESSRVSNKLTLEVVIDVSKDDIKLDFSFIRFILMARKLMSSSEVIELISKHKEVKASSFYKKEWSNYYYCGSDREPTGMISFFSKVKDFSNKKRLLLGWDVPSHVLENFNEVMITAYDKFELDLDKVSNAMYFYNNLSRDYGRLFVEDFALNHLKTFSKEVKLLDNVKTGRFTLKVPKTYQELVKWGASLNNCAGNFDQIEYYSKGLAVGVFEEGKIVYLIDYREKYGRKQINQLKGFKNCVVKTAVEFKEIVAPFITHNLSSLEDLKNIKQKDH